MTNQEIGKCLMFEIKQNVFGADILLRIQGLNHKQFRGLYKKGYSNKENNKQYKDEDPIQLMCNLENDMEELKKTYSKRVYTMILEG